MLSPNKKMLELKQKQLELNFANDVEEGLSHPQKYIPSKYFYDDIGSRLFEKIMQLPEYYPTRCEWQIFEDERENILKYLDGDEFSLIDLGAGDGEKTKVLLRHLIEKKVKFTYTPIDISKDILEKLLTALDGEMPGLEIQAVVAEYFDALNWLNKNAPGKKLVLFMGGNIGNFMKEDVEDFLKKMHASLNDGDLLLMGIDLKKDPFTIIKAYSDHQGVTAEFNYNVLRRINNELGGNFDLMEWEHYASYNPHTGATESFLISQKEQDVNIGELNKTFHFEPFEAIHTEFSFKYTLGEIAALAKKTGFVVEQNFISSIAYFTDSLWRVKK